MYACVQARSLALSFARVYLRECVLVYTSVSGRVLVSVRMCVIAFVGSAVTGG